MKIHQLSLFIENRSGQLRVPTKILSDNGIDIKTLSLADTQQFGILRLIVDDWKLAKELLEEKGCVVKVTEVLAIAVPDHPGGLDGVLAVIEEEGMNVEYMYAFTYGQQDQAVLIFRFDDVDKALEKLSARGLNVLQSVQVYEKGER